MSLNDLAISLIRTAAGIAGGLLVAWLASFGLDFIDVDLATGIAVWVMTVGYYAIARLVPGAERLLALDVPPSYPSTTDSVEA